MLSHVHHVDLWGLMLLIIDWVVSWLLLNFLYFVLIWVVLGPHFGILIVRLEIVYGHLSRVHIHQFRFQMTHIWWLIARVSTALLIFLYIFGLNYLEVFILARSLTTLCLLLILTGPAVVLDVFPVITLLPSVLLDG